MRARGRQAIPLARDSAFNRLAILSAAAAFVTLVLGSYISGTDASLACRGWPLCNGSVFPGGGSAVGLHFLHRLLAVTLGLLLLGLAYLAYEERRGQRGLLALALAAGAAYIAQALVGAANIWTDLAAGVVVTHLSLAALLWCSTVLISTIAFYLPSERARAGAGERAGARRSAQWAP
jgi:heme A synthase